MKLRKRNAFTLIELIATLVIMAIIALIVTPLVMSIIRKARISADKRSIDAYGRSIELAIAGYLMDNGSFPTSIEQLTIEYSGDEVVCSTTQLNTDSSVYLAGCQVAGRSTGDYTYGADKNPVVYDEYEIGDIVTYNNIDFYVIEDSNQSNQTVKLLKADALSAEDVETYSDGTGASISGQYMEYHPNSNDYSISYIKTAVEVWGNSNFSLGLREVRLITLDELKKNLGYELDQKSTVATYVPTEKTPSWIYNFDYWTMSPYEDSTSKVWLVTSIGNVQGSESFMYFRGFIRPVIVLDKSVL